MPTRRFLAGAAVVVGLACILAASTAHASKRPTIRPVDGGLAREAIGADPRITADTVCTVGPSGISNESIDLLELFGFGPDQYFTRISGTDCLAECPNTTRIKPQFINIVLNWRSTCTQAVIFRFVEGKWQGGTRRADITKPLTEYYSYGLFHVAQFPGPDAVYMKQYVLQLPDTISCLPRDCFLEATFQEYGIGCNSEDLFVEWTFDSLRTCPTNTFWNYYTDEEGNHQDDLCDTGSLETPIALWVDGVCCAFVPTKKTTWGDVRRRYH